MKRKKYASNLIVYLLAFTILYHILLLSIGWSTFIIQYLPNINVNRTIAVIFSIYCGLSLMLLDYLD